MVDNKKRQDKLTVFIYGCLLRNEILFSYTTDALATLEQHRLYKQLIKHVAKDAKKELRRYDKMVETEIAIGDKRNLLDDLSDIYISKVKHVFDNYKSAVRNTFNLASEEDARLLEDISIVSILVQLFCQRLDGDIDHEKDISSRLRRLNYLKPKAMKHKWLTLCSLIDNSLGINWHKVNLDLINEAFSKIDDVMADYNIIVKVIQEIKNE